MTALVTGSKGFIGQWLYDYLEGLGHEVVGDRHRDPDFDIRKDSQVGQLVHTTDPDWVFHLAAQSFPSVSFVSPQETLATNVIGTCNLLEAIRKHAPTARMLFVSSSSVYGGSDIHLTEDLPLHPLSPYAASKAAAEILCEEYEASYNLHVVIVRLFGTTGPGKVGDAIGDFCQRLAKGESPLRVGNLSTRRDLTDVRDVVRALVSIMWALDGPTWRDRLKLNICQGTAYQMEDLLTQLVKLAGGEINVQVDKSLFRPTDEPLILGDLRKLKRLTGWYPRIPIAQTLEESLQWWKESIAGPRAE